MSRAALRRAAAAAALALAACSTGPTTVGLLVERPGAIVRFDGVAHAPAAGATPAVQPLIAIAAERGDELRLLDPTNDLPIFGQSVVFPLSVPTDPRPRLLAAASLGDDGADLLAVVSTGAAAVQLVETWSGNVVAHAAIALDGADLLGTGAEIVSAVGVPQASGKGTARLILGATGNGGRLVVLDFTRDASGAVVLAPPAGATTGVVKALGFLPADLALGPGLPRAADGSYPTKLYVASPDPIGSAKGVAQLDPFANAADVWSVEATLTAGAGTVAVAAAVVDERVVDPSASSCRPAEFQQNPRPLVYAALSQEDCGFTKDINCGIATLDPDPSSRTLATDPAEVFRGSLPTSVPPQGYRAPMPVPGIPLRIAIVTPPSKTQARIIALDQNVPSSNCQSTGSPTSPLMRILPVGGFQDTSALAVVTSSDGRVYWYDLSRWAPVNDTASPVPNTLVLSASTATVGAGSWTLGLVDDSGSQTIDPAVLRGDVQLWPGFVDTASWALTWQGALPSLQRQSGTLVADASGAIYAAYQIANVADPALGVLSGDILELTDLGCGDGSIAEVIPAGSTAAGQTFPGGAVRVATAPSCTPAAVAANPGVPYATTLTVRAQGLVLMNSTRGYLGRPVLDTVFELGWQDPASIQASVTDPREQAVALAVNRKLRRVFYPNDYPCPIPGFPAGTTGALSAGCYAGFPRLSDPLQPGPMVRFHAVAYHVPQPAPSGATPQLARDLTLVFSTTNALSGTARHPSSGGALPGGIAVLDPSGLSNQAADEPMHVYVPYADDQILKFSPAQSSTQIQSLR